VPRPRAIALAALVLPLVLAPVLGGAADARPHKKKTPDLVVLGGLLTTVDGTLSGTVTVVNKGTKQAELSSTSLSYGGTVLDTYTTLGLKPGKAVKVKVDLPAPATGDYDLRACADSGNADKEKNEKNNCATVDVSPPQSSRQSANR